MLRRWVDVGQIRRVASNAIVSSPRMPFDLHIMGHMLLLSGRHPRLQ